LRLNSKILSSVPWLIQETIRLPRSLLEITEPLRTLRWQ